MKAPAFYQAQLFYLATVCLIALYGDRYVSRKTKASRARTDNLENGTEKPVNQSALAALTKKYLLVYAIVMGADWLQGPYVYSLYKDQYGFPERLVALLFVTGFISAGFLAPLVGAWADIHGRRRLCLVFCITYTLSCIFILIPYLPILLAGRVLGGLSTSILFSVFESWLLSESTTLGLPSADISNIMGRATLINGFVATSAGVVSNELVALTHNFASPFIASGGLLILAWVVIRSRWTENFGATVGTVDRDVFQVKRLGIAWGIVKRDPLLLVLGLTQTCFEGSMYLFVFLWVPSLQEPALTYAALPLGYIFASFMISMMLGSLLYTAIVSSQRGAVDHRKDSTLTLHAKLSSIVCALSALSLAISVTYNAEHIRFWAFCVFEACVGMYYPVQGTLRGTLISNEHRATLSSLFRVPLNIFVVVSLLTGVSSARRAVLIASSIMLLFSSLITALILVDRPDHERRPSADPVCAS